MSQKKTPKLGIGIDLGTGNAAACIAEHGATTPVESAIDGAQIPTIAFYDPKTDNWHVGKEAILRSYGQTDDCLFMHPKRNVPGHARDVLYGGKFTPVEVLTQILVYLRKVLLAAFPALADYPQFGGTNKNAQDLSLILTTPANWSIEEHDAYEEALRAAGFNDFDGFIAEPVAAARHVARNSQTILNNGDTVVVVDIGAGTTDIAVLEFRQGVYHQVAAASGDGYLAGNDFTDAIAGDIATQHSVPWENVYGKGGLNLVGVTPEDRPRVMAVWFAAEEAKKTLAILEQATVAVDYPDGRKIYSIDRSKAHQLWQPLHGRFRQCVSSSLDGTKLQFTDIRHAMLVGGSSPTPGLRSEMADAMGRDPSSVLVCTKSEHVIAAGAAEHALFQDEASQSLESGLGFTVLDAATSRHCHLVMVQPGQIVPPEGLFLERQGFAIDTSGGRQTLICRPFACKRGVQAVVVDGRDTLLADSEIARLEDVEASLDHLPDGQHNVSLGVKVDPNRRLWLLARPSDLPHIEPLNIPLNVHHANGKASAANFPDAVLVLDTSHSMAKEKIEMMKRGAVRFLDDAEQRGAAVAIVVFGGYGPKSHGAAILCDFVVPIEEKKRAVQGLCPNGGTPLDKGVVVATELLAARAVANDAVVIIFTDGAPDNRKAAERAAEDLKRSARLITVGIGEDVITPWLVALASSPGDYFYAEAPQDILGVWLAVAELIRTTASLP